MFELNAFVCFNEVLELSVCVFSVKCLTEIKLEQTLGWLFFHAHLLEKMKCRSALPEYFSKQTTQLQIIVRGH